MPTPPQPDPLGWLRSVIAYVTSPVQRDRGRGQDAAGRAISPMIPDIRPLTGPRTTRQAPTSSAGPLITHDQARVQAELVNLRLSGKGVASSRRPRRKP